MKPEEFRSKAVAHIVAMLEGKKGEEWNGEHPICEGVCGWCGVMSPLNRPAFVKQFGEAVTKGLEQMAIEEIEGRRAWWNNSKAAAHEKQANEQKGAAPSEFAVGDFVWGIMDGLKCDHGDLRRAIRNFINDEEGSEEWRKEARRPRLCKITRIEEVEDVERDAATLLQKWAPKGREGGWGSDDLTDEEFEHLNYCDLTDEQKRSIYTLSVLVRDSKGRWFLIDPEGFDYPRYVILPVEWKGMYAETVAAVKAEKEAERKAAEEAKAKEEAEARAAYEERCRRWEGLMTPATPQKWGVDTATGKKNVLAMAKAAFPWVRFWVSYSSGWGHGYTLKWTNGPTVDEVKAATNFGLFSLGVDTFNGYDDSTGYSHARFTDFAERFGGVDNGVDFCRQTAEKDQNKDPDKTPPKTPSPRGGGGGNSVEVCHNEKKNGIEIYFDSVPSEAVRNELKGRGFRWSRFSKCWYITYSDDALEFAKGLASRLNNGKAAA